MQTQYNIPLSELTTMRLGGPVQSIITVNTADELAEVVNQLGNTPFFVLGGGSNVIAHDEGFAGTIILNRILGFEVIRQDMQHAEVRIGAGENWDTVVERLASMGLSGCEAMSAIPGTAGATPVQNVGAYGQEIADTLVELEAYDTKTDSFITLKNTDCHFTYRNSIFKDPTTRHHIITSIVLRLNKTTMRPPFYASLQKYLDEHEITDYSPQAIRAAVSAIRAVKLPDPKQVANTGSFFKNPIVDSITADQIIKLWPELPHFPAGDGMVKLAAGWLIEQAKLKGYAAHGFKTYENNALVVVNESAHSYAELQAFKNEIIERVLEKFGVTLEQEPETL